MQCLIDGNIILDVLSNREPFVADSSKIWKLCETRQLDGYVSVLTFADLVYILRKELDPEKIDLIFHSLKLIFRFVGLDESDLMQATALRWDDFEDAIQSVSASNIKADYIITRNTKDYTKSTIKAITPSSFLKGS